MDPVSTITNRDTMNLEDENEAVTDLNAHLGDLQIGGGGDILLDDYDPVDDKPDVAIITPEDSAEEKETEILANDCIVSLKNAAPFMYSNYWADDAMRTRVLPQISDLETESETVHTWELEGWGNLPKKARGPTFECGGHPWYGA